MPKEKIHDPIMDVVKERLEKSGMTYQQLGEQMGYSPKSARQAVSQFLNSGDPHISMLRKFAKAMGVSLTTLIR
ncbi:MAG: helix-turn-helix transcriptional regulator [Planctomycetaceae bacterium]|nr:helix-turn-helix transcriptional regulator [Planctomycetaceae bacterium]MCA9044133.1 helix-turn-helix transcriptional regulator [Planctomycetaceae bacterium]